MPSAEMYPQMAWYLVLFLLKLIVEVFIAVIGHAAYHGIAADQRLGDQHIRSCGPHNCVSVQRLLEVP